MDLYISEEQGMCLEEHSHRRPTRDDGTEVAAAPEGSTGGYSNAQSHWHQLVSADVVKRKVRRKAQPFKDPLEMGRDLFSDLSI